MNQIDSSTPLEHRECIFCKRMEEHTIIPLEGENLHWAKVYNVHLEGNPPIAHFPPRRKTLQESHDPSKLERRNTASVDLDLATEEKVIQESTLEMNAGGVSSEEFDSPFSDSNHNAFMAEIKAKIETFKARNKVFKKKYDAWEVENERFKAEVASLVFSFHELKRNMAFVPGSPVRARNSAKLNAMTNGRFETLGDLEVEYEDYLLKERIFWIHGGNLALNLAKFVCASTNVRCVEGDRAQEDIQSTNSVELVEVEVKEFLEKAFRGEE